MEWAWLTLVGVCLVTSIVDGQSCLDAGQGHVDENKRMKNHVSTILEFLGLFECIAMCKAKGYACKSVNFYLNSQFCELNSEDSDGAPDDVVSADGVIFCDVANWSKAITGACSEATCLRTEMCVVDRNNRPKCTALSCGKPFPVDNADMIYTNTNLGAIVTYICNDGYLGCSDSDGNVTSLCLETGTWSKVNGHCGLKVSFLKNVGRRATFQCSNKDKWKVTMAAIPTDNTFFTVSVMQSRPFRLLVRLAVNIDHDSCKQTIAFGLRRGCGFPSVVSFSADKRIDLILQFDRSVYQLMIQGRVLATYNAPNGINASRIVPFGDVNVTEFTIEY